jgi:hypothetical protein
MARDHNLESCGFRLQFELRQIVHHVDGNADDLGDFIFPKFTGPRPFVDIAADRSEGRKVCELFQDFWRANVAGVDDALRASQCQQRFGPQQAMGIGDDADEDGSPSSQSLVSSSRFISA